MWCVGSVLVGGGVGDVADVVVSVGVRGGGAGSVVVVVAVAVAVAVGACLAVGCC